MARPVIPQWLARKAAERVVWDDEMVRCWVTRNLSAQVVATVTGIERAGFQVVKLDPNTEPGERPIVLVRITPADLEGVTIHPDELVDPNA